GGGPTPTVTLTAAGAVTSGPHTPSATQAGTGDTIGYTFGLASTGIANPQHVTTVALTGPQDLTGTPKAPPGTTVTYSTDGTTFGSSPTGARFLKFAGPLAAGGSGVAQLATATPAPFTTAGGDDGYIPIVAGDRVFNIYHHTDMTLVCHMITD